MKVFSNRHKSLSGLTTKSSNTNTGQQIRIMTEETSQGSLPAAWRVSYCLDKSCQTAINFTGIYLRLGKEKTSHQRQQLLLRYKRHVGVTHTQQRQHPGCNTFVQVWHSLSACV